MKSGNRQYLGQSPCNTAKEWNFFKGLVSSMPENTLA